MGRFDQSLTGIVTARNGKHALNGLVTRVFTAGRLKGLSVGGNFHWRSAGTIGYQRLPDTLGRPRGAIDVSRPLSGEDFWDLGAVVAYEHRPRHFILTSTFTFRARGAARADAPSL